MGVDPSGLSANCSWYKGCFSWIGKPLHTALHLKESINSGFGSYDSTKTTTIKKTKTKVVTSKSMDLAISTVIELSDQKSFLGAVKEMGGSLDLSLTITSMYKNLFNAHARSIQYMEMCAAVRNDSDANIACMEMQTDFRSEFYSNIDRELLPKLKKVYISAIRMTNQPTDWMFAVYEVMQELKGSQ